jgi:aspartyl-tRNA(Asn)/glutamyl-tRNA(Gln) amidotransferase subunit B
MNKTQQVIGLLITKDYIKRPEEFYESLKNIMVNDLFALMGEEWEISRVEKEKPHIKELLNDLAFLLSGGQIESRHVKIILANAWETEPYAWDLGWYLSDTKLLDGVSGSDLSSIVAKVIEANPKVKADIIKGKTQAIGFLIGQIMKETKGKTDPNQAKKEIETYLNGKV